MSTQNAVMIEFSTAVILIAKYPAERPFNIWVLPYLLNSTIMYLYMLEQEVLRIERRGVMATVTTTASTISGLSIL